ncbi:MAG: hypothetical protein DRO23_02440 [Thermoprotei archaeon]|nr:MAG: hypothetical protein DRO23_02440 [Thermoprotei archaeon]
MIHVLLALLIVIAANEIYRLRGYENILDYIVYHREYWLLIFIAASLILAAVYDIYVLRSMAEIKRRL